MKNVMLGALLLVAWNSSGAEVKFLNGSLGDAAAKAKAEQKSILIDFMTDWCRWCDTLDARTYPDKAVSEFVNATLVPIKIDAEKGDGIAIAKKYGVRAFPTILLIRADGEEIDRLVGYDPPEQFLKKVSDYMHGVNTLGALNEAAAKNPADASVHYRLAQKYGDRNDAAASTEHFQQMLALDPADKLGHNEEARYTIAMTSFMGSKDPAKVDDFLDRYPNSPMRRGALYTLWRTFTRDKDGEKAKKYFDLYLEINPRDAGMMNNYAWGCAEAGINLDHASAVAHQAVALASNPGERAMYLDTFAHVEFKRGNVRDAISKEQEALDLLNGASPKERKPYEEALAKFKNGGAN